MPDRPLPAAHARAQRPSSLPCRAGAGRHDPGGRVHGQYAKRDRNKKRGGHQPAHQIHHRATRPRPRPCSSRTRPALPEGRGRERALLPEVQRRRAARARPAGMPERLEDRLRHGASAPRPRSCRRRECQVTLFNGTPQGGNPTIIIYAVPDLGPVMTLPGVLRSGRGTPVRLRARHRVPPIQTLPSAPDASVTFFDATTRDLTVRRRGRTIHYIDSPVLCNGTFFLLDGAVHLPGRHQGRRARALHAHGGPRCP